MKVNFLFFKPKIAPLILTCHLKRFNKYMEKINKTIEFSEILDLSKYTSEHIDKKDKSHKNDNKYLYKLFAVVVHRGYDLFSGHYYAYVRGLDNNWYVCNDEQIGQVSIGKILKENAYILLYQRQNLTNPIRKNSNTIKTQENMPMAKNKGEAQKMAKKLLSDIFEKPNLKEVKPSPMPAEPLKKFELLPNFKKDDDESDPMQDSESSENSDSENEKMKDDFVGKSPRIISPTRKRMKMLRINQHVVCEKRFKKLEEECNQVTEVMRKYYKAEGKIETWDRKTSNKLAERLELMKNESLIKEKRTKNEHDLEYDKGKTKKIRDKTKQKQRKAGLQNLLDMAQILREQISTFS